MPAASVGQWVLLNCSTVTPGGTQHTEVDGGGCERGKCREALSSVLLLLPHLTPVPGSGWTCSSRCGKRCCSKSSMNKFILKSAAPLNSMTPETRVDPLFGASAPTSSRRTLRSHRLLTLPIDA